MRPFLFLESDLLANLPVSVEISARESQEDTMFTDSLLESGWGSGSHRVWTTLTSFSLQALALGILLALPLLYTQGLPQLTLLRPLVAPTPPPAPPAPTPMPRTSTSSG